LLYVYSVTAVRSAKASAQRLREQDGGTLDLHRQSLRQHGLLDDRASVADEFRKEREHEEALKAESRRQKEEARLRQLEEWKGENERNRSVWKWFWGK